MSRGIAAFQENAEILRRRRTCLGTTFDTPDSPWYESGLMSTLGRGKPHLYLSSHEDKDAACRLERHFHDGLCRRALIGSWNFPEAVKPQHGKLAGVTRGEGARTTVQPRLYAFG